MDGNIKGLVSAGHEMASELKAECGAVDMRSVAKLISDLATQLEVQLVRANALAAENAGLKSDIPLGAIENGRAFADRLENYQFECEGGNLNMCSDWQEFRRCFEYLSEWAMHSQTEHPATDAFLAEIRAEARNEGINYTASRLAAAFNHGFINKSLREVFDVTRMILSAKEELANEPHPIDGLSGEYAEKSLGEWAEQIRKGGNQ
ncbi:hypothetical protein FLY72_000505 [Escherichia coli]|uniref:hypothetical protein n=1 Tax=Escherichia coli TaxID=562 RepID=UPI0008549329|nr:hypothetical protein [Escherichia coli]EET1508750.1 hypothetical protein [Escherichia coli]EIR7617357.1 hypothetical protein [Escherichia coli]ELA5106364.1 hypothetical protein [Escherichia coli]ELI0550894.1 hypothetical protein [Escherichia coli]OEN45458.1 hypothetical protein BHF44_02335 [Escherichia coli]